MLKGFLGVQVLTSLVLVCGPGDHERDKGHQRRGQDAPCLVHLLHGEGKNSDEKLTGGSARPEVTVVTASSSSTPPSHHPPTFLFLCLVVQFKDQVVREAVEKICREFSGQCCIHKPLGGGAGAVGGAGGRGEAVGGGEAQQVPEVSSSALPGAPTSSTPPCSSCRGQTTGGGYQCRCVVQKKRK